MALPGDVLIALAEYLPDGRRCFSSNYKQIEEFFYAQRETAPAIIQSLNFNASGESHDLRQAISDLALCRLIVSNPGNPRDYHFSKRCAGSFKRFAQSRLTPSELSELEQVAKAFDEQLARPNTLDC